MGNDVAGLGIPKARFGRSLTLPFRFAVFRSSKENEYFQLFTDLQLISRVEAEFAIFHPQAPVGLKGRQCGGLQNLHKKETV